MTPYGSKISYDTTATPIKMTVSHDVLEGVTRQFSESYKLPFQVLPSETGNASTLVFDNSVDEETFLRHLRTTTPEHYEGMTA